MADLSKITDDELEQMIAEKFGEEWMLQEVPADDELIVEFARRISEAID